MRIDDSAIRDAFLSAKSGVTQAELAADIAKRDDGKFAGNIATASFVAAGVGLTLATIGLAIWPRDKSPSTGATITPTVTTGTTARPTRKTFSWSSSEKMKKAQVESMLSSSETLPLDRVDRVTCGLSRCSPPTASGQGMRRCHTRLKACTSSSGRRRYRP